MPAGRLARMSVPIVTVPILTDGLITLRAHRLEDADAIVEQSADPESLRWTTVPRPYTADHAVEFIEGNLRDWESPAAKRSWAIECFDDDGRRRFGGTIDLRPTAVASAGELGFGLHPAARGRGLMTRAVRLVAAYGFGTSVWGRPLVRVHWRAVVGNWASRRAVWAAGFTFHGTIPDSHPDPFGGPDALDTWTGSIGAGDTAAAQTPWFVPPTIEGDGLRLRAWRPEDIDAIEPRSDDPQHWMPSRGVLRRETFPEWLHMRREREAAGTAIDWCVADASTDRALGGVGLFDRGGPMTGDTAELGYQLFPSARGRGVAKSAARLAIAHAFRPREEGGLGMRRLVAQTAADNEASNAVLRSNGFVTFGREHRVDLLADGSYGDGLFWELISG
jgi:RimJ/RimL family protein N-acetyltransferase